MSRGKNPNELSHDSIHSTTILFSTGKKIDENLKKDLTYLLKQNFIGHLKNKFKLENNISEESIYFSFELLYKENL